MESVLVSHVKSFFWDLVVLPRLGVTNRDATAAVSVCWCQHSVSALSESCWCQHLSDVDILEVAVTCCSFCGTCACIFFDFL